MTPTPGAVTGTASTVVRKVRLKLPRLVGESTALRALQDWLTASHHLSRKNLIRLDTNLRECKTVDDYIDFASHLLPSHQIRSEISKFLRFAAGEGPRIVCEIGTAEGGTTFLLSHAIPTVELMLGIDLFVWNRRLLRRFGRPGTRMSFLNGSSHSQRTLERTKQLLAGRAIDLLFIDGDHTYRGVAHDFLTYGALVRDGGLVAFHDIVPDFFSRYGRATGRWAGDVHLFWSKVRRLFEHREFVEDAQQDGLGIGVIRYKRGVDLGLD